MNLYVYEMSFKQDKSRFFSNSKEQKVIEKYYLFDQLNEARNHAISNAPKNVKNIKFYAAEIKAKSYSYNDQASSRKLSFSAKEPTWINDLNDLENLTPILTLVCVNNEWRTRVNNTITDVDIAEGASPNKHCCRLL
ncbi:hypothetical protein Lsan_3479 [Legionella santicrucis]|uniref:Uncharacterized protein n=1 Tax=Legionella santicrucis TaxID=45074 RepID=A0A0W0YA67_9GAMM|nr:hypothetical protein [Legionella santicrucis]KTD53815.1 hypothetical protein Lsan_3479 [Legionella santicrucis]